MNSKGAQTNITGHYVLQKKDKLQIPYLKFCESTAYGDANIRQLPLLFQTMAGVW